MTANYLQEKSALITGGTRGLGKQIGLEFARAGASVYLTHRWGSVDEQELIAEFRSQGLSQPKIIESDVSDPEARLELMHVIKDREGSLDILVSNVAFSKIIRELEDLKKSTLDLSLGYSAWPLVGYIQAAKQVLGEFPHYVISISNDGLEVCHDSYDLAGVSKAALETLCRYMAIRLKKHGVRVNVVRASFLDTASSRATFGNDAINAMGSRVEGFLMDPKGVARVCLALCSGLMDSVTGQVIIVDEGWSLVSPLAYITGQGLPSDFPHPDEENA